MPCLRSNKRNQTPPIFLRPRFFFGYHVHLFARYDRHHCRTAAFETHQICSPATIIKYLLLLSTVLLRHVDRINTGRKEARSRGEDGNSRVDRDSCRVRYSLLS